MTSTQYKNVIDYTLTQLPAEADSLTTVREILRNCGTPLPQGTPNQILNTLLSDDYMGWNECTYRDAVGYANAGVVAIGVGSDSIMLIEPQTDKPAASDAVAASASKENRAAMVYYTYSSKSTTTNRSWFFYANKVIDVAKSYLGMSRDEILATNSPIPLLDNAWCVDFVRLCCKIAGVYHKNENIKETSSTGDMHDWFKNNFPSRFHEGTKGILKGDIVFIKKNGNLTHTCLAADTPKSDGSLLTINGNWLNKNIDEKNRRVLYSTFPTSGQYVDSYAHPNYYY